MEQNTVNILCMKWGEKYGSEYVNRLYSMVSRNLTIPFRFICFTDSHLGINENVEILPIPDLDADLEDTAGRKRVQAWKKLTTFANPLYDIKGICLFLDLDVVIIDNIDCFFEPEGPFFIIRDWTATEDHGNSSVYRFEAGSLSPVLDDFVSNRDTMVEQYNNEQHYLSEKIIEISDIQFWPEDWCLSYRRQCLHKNRLMRWIKPSEKPDFGKIIIFHGAPSPEEAIAGIGDRWYRQLRPARWLADYWC